MTENPPSILSQWHATPLSRREASRLNSRAELLIPVIRGRKASRLAHISRMCSRYWLGEFSQFDFDLLAQSLGGSRHLQALLFLTYGQLLMARKRQGAFAYLDHGLRLADGILKAQVYFEVYNRHEALRSLKLSEKGSDGLSLKALLTEAAVIDKISQKSGTEMMFQPSRFDTLINKSWN